MPRLVSANGILARLIKLPTAATAGGVKNALSNVDFTKPMSDGLSNADSITTLGTIVPKLSAVLLLRKRPDIGLPSVPSPGGDFNIPGPMVPGWKLEDILPGLTSRAEKWIEDAAQAKKPFFLYFALTSPHYPVVPSKDFVGTTKVGAYGDFVHQTDWCVGRVLDALQRSGVGRILWLSSPVTMAPR